ncbi:hypothetical protein I3842_14G115400 [Carya illinoinensis]|uniref:Uncharacterized protein n=1 Tax=Carya illinoinensis TaxID=32201 RepID=A0A922AK08_CARIL|nr:hypothetical protein I3842_14G115400 [Carya illinoinensis]
MDGYFCGICSPTGVNQISVFSIQASRYRRRTYCNCSVHIPCTTCCFLPCNVHIQLHFFPCCVINILFPFILNNIVKVLF